MSVLENRLRLGRRRCQQWRRYLADLESLAQQLRTDEQQLWAEVELAVAGPTSPEAGAGRPDFAREPGGRLAGEPAGKLIERHGKLARSVAAIDTQIAEVGAALGAAERELRGLELATEQPTARAGLSGPRRSRRNPIAALPIARRDR
jgi:hypothetical protein